MSGQHDPLGANDGSPAPTIDPEGVACPAPIGEGERVILGHGSGGQLSNALLRDVIGPALAAAAPGGPLNDAAVVDVAGTRVAFTTDSFVVSPIRFPGGDIVELAFRLPGGREEYLARAEVVRVRSPRPDRPEMMPGLGLRFVAVDDVAFDAIGDYVEQRMPRFSPA